MFLINTYSFNIGDHFLPFRHSPEHSVLAVKPRTRYCGDVELGTVGILAAVRHRQHKGLPMLQLLRDLVLELTAPNAGTARPVTIRVACLYHETFDDSVED